MKTTHHITLSLFLSSSIASAQTLPATQSATQPTQEINAAKERSNIKQPNPKLLVFGVPFLVAGVALNTVGAVGVATSDNVISTIFSAGIFSVGLAVDLVGIIPVSIYTVQKIKAKRAIP